MILIRTNPTPFYKNVQYNGVELPEISQHRYPSWKMSH